MYKGLERGFAVRYTVQAYMGMAVFQEIGRKAIWMRQEGGDSLEFSIGIWYWIPLWNKSLIGFWCINSSLWQKVVLWCQYAMSVFTSMAAVTLLWNSIKY